jgi:hypothetical protein
MFIVDDYTILIWVYFLKEKSEAFEKFQTHKSLVENDTDFKIKCLRSDNGGEFTSKFSFNSMKIMVSKENFHLSGLLNRMEW